jgi:predicted RNA-binding protein with PIN domain
MALLIDGYNLLYASGIIGRGIGPGGLHRSRIALLNFLAESLDPDQLRRATVVFDSHDAPWGVPQRVEHRGIIVRFAAKYESADDLLEELIRADTAPRRLVVVSSDHRIQRAAHRRRAIPVDSDVWYADLLRARRERQARDKSSVASAKPPVPLLAEDVEYWLRQFGGESALTAFLADTTESSGVSSAEPTKSAPSRQSAGVPEDAEKPEDLDNPFPPGYGDDLLENDSL